jgi:tol-pal system protein YbgF
MRVRTLLILPLCLAAAGCVATQQDMLQMQSQMDDLNNNLTTMQRNQAELAVKMENLSTNLNASSESMKDISAEMEKLSARLDALDSNMDKRVNAIGRTITKQQEEVEASLLPAKMYGDAYNAFMNDNFDGAVTGFKAYLSKFPNGEMAEGSYYYLGESLYLKEHWQDAALAYATVLEKFPQSARVPAARLKYALSLLKLDEKGKKDEAVKYLRSIVKDFPGSQEAGTAKDTLNKLYPPKTKAPAKHKVRKAQAAG